MPDDYTEEELLELLQAAVMETRTTFPTDCEDGCEVEPDGQCNHGGISLLRKAGLI